jgi:hypothetical protein
MSDQARTFKRMQSAENQIQLQTELISIGMQCFEFVSAINHHANGKTHVLKGSYREGGH